MASYRDDMTDAIESIEPLGEEDVFDLTEQVTHHFVANGLVVHNCSEYMFFDDTACNLASLNLITFHDRAANRFDIDGFRHATRLWTMTLEISVLMAQFPSHSDRRAFVRVPHARPGLREPRHAADGDRYPVRLAAGARDLRRPHGDPDGRPPTPRPP